MKNQCCVPNCTEEARSYDLFDNKEYTSLCNKHFMNWFFHEEDDSEKALQAIKEGNFKRIKYKIDFTGPTDQS